MCMKQIAARAAALCLLSCFLPAESPPEGGGLLPPGEAPAVPSLEAAFRGLEFFTGLAFQENRREEAGEGAPDRKVRADSGAALRLQDVKLILAGGLPYTAPAELGEDPAACWADRGVKRGGISVRLADNRLRYVPEVLYGTLHFAASLSRLRQPCRSVPWNCGSLSLPAPGLAAALPGFSSAERPPALALVLEPAGGLPLPVLEVAAVEGGDIYAGLHAELPVPRSSSSCIVLAVNGGSFVYGGKEVKSWFYRDPFYRESRYLSADAELGFRLERAVSAHFAAGFSENPFGSFTEAFFWRREQLACSFAGLGLTASHFAAEKAEMILPGGSRLNTKRRLSLNPSIRFPLGQGRASLALLGAKDEKVKDGTERDVVNFGMKGSFRLRRSQWDLQYTDRFSEEPGDADAQRIRKLGLGFSCRGRSFSSSSSVSVKRDGEKDTVSFSQKFTPAGTALSEISLGISSVYAEGTLEKLRLTAGSGFRFRTRRTSFRGKFLYSATFYGEF